MATFNFYRPEDNWYVRIVRASDGFIWDQNGGVMAASPSWANSILTMSWDSTIKAYPVNVPTLPLGDYDILFYNAVSPADTDEIQYGQEYSVDPFAV